MIRPVFGWAKAFFEPDGDAMPGTKKDSFKVVPQVLQFVDFAFHRL